MRALIIIAVLLGATATIAYSLRVLLTSEQSAEPEAIPLRTLSGGQAGKVAAVAYGSGDAARGGAEHDDPAAPDIRDAPLPSSEINEHRSLVASGGEENDAARVQALTNEQLDVARASLRLALRREQDATTKAARDSAALQGELRAVRAQGVELAQKVSDGDGKNAALTIALRARGDELDSEHHRSAEQRDKAEGERIASASEIATLTARIGAVTTETADLRGKLVRSQALANEMQVRLSRAEGLTSALADANARADALRSAAADTALQLKAAAERESELKRQVALGLVRLALDKEALSRLLTEQAELRAQPKAARTDGETLSEARRRWATMLEGAVRLRRIRDELARERQRCAAAEQRVAALHVANTDQLARIEVSTRARQELETSHQTVLHVLRDEERRSIAAEPGEADVQSEQASLSAGPQASGEACQRRATDGPHVVDGSRASPLAILATVRNERVASNDHGDTRSSQRPLVSKPISVPLDPQSRSGSQGGAAVEERRQEMQPSGVGSTSAAKAASASLEIPDIHEAAAPEPRAVATHTALPDAISGHILLHYEHKSTRPRARAQALLAALRSMGADVEDVAGLGAGRAANAITYFYTQDRDLADRIAQELDGSIPVRPRGSDGKLPRPGTIEVSIGD